MAVAARAFPSSTEPMRVLHVVPAPFDVETGIIGGAERYAFELARHMARETPTRLVAFGEHEAETQVEGLGVRVIGGARYVRGQRTNPIAAALIGELRGADVVHCHQQHVLASSLSALFCRLSRRRVYVTDLGGGGWDISGYVATDRWYHGHLHISEYSREVSGHRGKPYAHVIWGGVDLEKFAPGEVPAPRSAVVYAGRILPHKGIDQLVRAMPPTIDLQIIGQQSDGAYLEELHRLAAGKRVVFRHDCDDRAGRRVSQRDLCRTAERLSHDVRKRDAGARAARADAARRHGMRSPNHLHGSREHAGDRREWGDRVYRAT